MTKLLELIYFAPQPRTLAASTFWLSLNIVGTHPYSRYKLPVLLTGKKKKGKKKKKTDFDRTINFSLLKLELPL